MLAAGKERLRLAADGYVESTGIKAGVKVRQFAEKKLRELFSAETNSKLSHPVPQCVRIDAE